MNGISVFVKPLLLVAASIVSGICFSSPTREFVPDKLVNPDAYYPEGPQIVADGLLVAEMSMDRLVLISTNGTNAVRVVWEEAGCGPTSVKLIPTGGYWVLCHMGHKVVRLNASFEKIRIFQQTVSARPISWPNDGSVDLKGNLYLSSSGIFSLGTPAEGRVIRIDVATDAATELADGIRYSNGVLVQRKLGRILVSEHLNRRVLSYPLLGPTKLGSPSVFFDFRSAPIVPDSYELSGPDGLASFLDGDICIPDYGNGRILVVSRDGNLLTQIPLKLRFVTNVAISADERSLFVTMIRDISSERLNGIVQKFIIKQKD